MTDYGPLLRTLTAPLLVHSYTRTPITQGSEDAWGDTADTAGTPVTALPCVLVWTDQFVNDDLGRRTIRTPQLYVPYDDTLTVGDRVSTVADAEGTTIAAGPMTVESLDPAAELGSSALRIATLRGATVAE
jgi:hypothetical protein